MDELKLWNKRVERWRDTSLTIAEYAAELGIDARMMRLAECGKLTKRLAKKGLPPVRTKPRWRRDRAAGMRSDADWFARNQPFPSQIPYSKLRRPKKWQVLAATIARVRAMRDSG